MELQRCRLALLCTKHQYTLPFSNNNNIRIGRELRTLIASIDRLNTFIGNCLSWLTVAMALAIGLVVIARMLDLGSLALQDSVSYMHASVFMLCLGFTLKEQGHVRVDIFYRQLSTQPKAWVNVLGSILFLLPFSLFLIFISWNFVQESWRILEGSSNPGGIQAIFVLKSLIPISGFLLALQGLAQLLQNTFILLEPSEAQ